MSKKQVPGTTYTIQCTDPNRKEEIRKGIEEVKWLWKGKHTAPEIMIAALGTFIGVLRRNHEEGQHRAASQDSEGNVTDLHAHSSR